MISKADGMVKYALLGIYVSRHVIRRKEMGTATDQSFVQSVHGVRYLVNDVARAVTFYTTHLGFTLKHQQLPAFASVSLGDVDILISGPQASGSRPMPDGREQAPGGWNRVVLRVDDLPGFIETLKKAGLRFRNEMLTGPAGRQVQIEDPDGNPVELFEPAR
jgi:glyoxylase I family protein